jgi:phosphate transport system substrate-binding protein
MVRFLALLFAAMLVAAPCVAATVAAGDTPPLASYVVKKLPPPPRDATYVMRDGSILIAGNDLMVPYMERLAALFCKHYPEYKFHMELQTSGLSVSGINSGKSALGPVARDVSFQEKDAFRSRHGYDLTDIQVGWDNTPDADHQPPGKYPPGVWVNVKNPTPSLTMDDIAGIFTTGSGKGDYTFWGQLEGHEGPIGGNGADYAKREIHVYMPKLERLPILATMRYVLGGAPWSKRIEHLPMMEDVINAVANDPFGIALIGWWPTDEGWDRAVELGDKVRFMPLAWDRHSRPSRGRVGDVYPLAGGLRFVVDKPPGKPLDPWLREFLTLALSKEGQELIGSMTVSNGFVPIDARDVGKELAKLR